MEILVQIPNVRTVLTESAVEKSRNLVPKMKDAKPESRRSWIVNMYDTLNVNSKPVRPYGHHGDDCSTLLWNKNGLTSDKRKVLTLYTF
ncbi:hypothetical protein DPMN_113630 [Dreissena polymorpha]|uniref:Uncharacterized protein n=1 Tax=Dreissena polymorpha TaxID=45954 RepID=A0A9D4KHR4_DREPO|nr:hypothetical protein DPMN_113630 [Dreissena polymorpha]